MEIINKDELRLRKEYFINKILKGDVFVYPTDTIYGIGCNAMNQESVEKVRNLKNRDPTKAFSVIVPSKDMLSSCCMINEETEKWLEKLPGAYTLILQLKNKECIPQNVNSGKDSLGIRIPEHWISEFVSELNVPLVSASANKRGDNYMTCLEDLDPEIKSKVDFIIYEGKKEGNPSTIVNIAGEGIDFSQTRKVINSK